MGFDARSKLWSRGISLHEIVDDVLSMDEPIQADRPGHGLDILQMQSSVANDLEEGKADQRGPACELIDAQLFVFHRIKHLLKYVQV